MASWFDLLSLFLTIGVFGGIIYTFMEAWSTLMDTVQDIKARLQEKGYIVSSSGVSVKTTGRMDRKAYLDATQRGLVRVWEASSFGTSPQSSPELPSEPPNFSSLRNPSISSEKSERNLSKRHRLSQKLSWRRDS